MGSIRDSQCRHHVSDSPCPSRPQRQIHSHRYRSLRLVRLGLATLYVTQCDLKTESCTGYGAVGYDTFINSPAKIGDIDVVKRPLADLAQITPLVYPLPPPGYWGQPSNFSWNNVDENDSTP